MHSYPALYRDQYGSETIVIYNDGKTLKTTIRGVVFSGEQLDDFEPAADTAPALLTTFMLYHGSLCGYTFVIEMPVPMMHDNQLLSANLQITHQLGVPVSNNRVESETVALKLAFLNHAYSALDEKGFIETAFLNLNLQLPANTFVKCCFNCLYSDYSIVGNGLFGTMLCFQNVRADYLNIKSKAEYNILMPTAARQVQETYLCDAFTPRIAGTGYRG